jgi:hypothetical protein
VPGTSLNRTLCNLEPSIKWTCFSSLRVFAVHIEPP